MGEKRRVRAGAIAVLGMGYFLGLIAFPNLPGPFLDERLSARESWWRSRCRPRPS